MTQALPFEPSVDQETEVDPAVESQLHDSIDPATRDTRGRLIPLAPIQIRLLEGAVRTPIQYPVHDLNTTELHQGNFPHRVRATVLRRLVAFGYLARREVQLNEGAEASRVWEYRTTRLGQIFIGELERGTTELLHKLAQRDAIRLVPTERNPNLFTLETTSNYRVTISRDQVAALISRDILLVQDARPVDETRLVMLNSALRSGGLADPTQPVEQRRARPRVQPVSPAHLDDEPRATSLIPAVLVQDASRLINNINGLIGDLRSWIPRKP